MFGYLDYIIYFWVFLFIIGNPVLAILGVFFWKGQLHTRIYSFVNFLFPEDNLIIRLIRKILYGGISCTFCCFSLGVILFLCGFSVYIGFAMKFGLQ